MPDGRRVQLPRLMGSVRFGSPCFTACDMERNGMEIEGHRETQEMTKSKWPGHVLLMGSLEQLEIRRYCNLQQKQAIS